MNVYDFDNTIYDGESVFDFYIFTVKKQLSLSKYMFVVLKSLIKYKLCMVSTYELARLAEKYATNYLKEVKNIDVLVKEFWDKNEHKIKSFYKNQKNSDDIIVSASFDILLKEIMQRLEIKNCVCSVVDMDKLKVKTLCYRKNKVKLFKNLFPDAMVDSFYTDSENDRAMMELANKTYIVKGKKIIEKS